MLGVGPPHFRVPASGEPRNKFAVFLAVGFIGLVINLAVIYVGVARLGLHYLVAEFAAAGCTFLANAVIRRWLLFTPWASASPAQSIEHE